MKLNKIYFIILLLLQCVLPLASIAQEELPSEQPASEDLPVESRQKLSKISFLRLWYFGSSESPRITVTCQPNSGDPIVLKSYLGIDRFSNYKAFRPGLYSLNVLPGDIIPDASGHIPTGNRPLTSSLKLDLKPGSFATVIVQENSGNFDKKFHIDKAPSEKEGPLITVFNLADFTDGRINLESQNERKEIWNAKLISPYTTNLLGITGTCQVNYVKKVNNQDLNLRSFEIEITPKSAYSIVLFKDRYNKDAMAVVKDTRGDVTSEELEELSRE